MFDEQINKAKWLGLHKAVLSMHEGSSRSVYTEQELWEMVIRLSNTLRGIDWSPLDPDEGFSNEGWRDI